MKHDWSFGAYVDELRPYIDAAREKLPDFSDDTIMRVAAANKALDDRAALRRVMAHAKAEPPTE